MKLPTGSVLPSSLLSKDTTSAVAGFNKSYKNNALRAGIVIKSYSPDSKENNSKLAPEYDVLVLEQDGNRAITPITYRNCLSSEGLGSIADYFEVKLREQKNAGGKAKGKEFAGQDGAIVLLLCLDENSQKGVIVGCLTHPDRKSKLVGTGQVLAGEFNGVSIAVSEDGSAKLVFKGATDSKGKPKDSSQGETSIEIEKDGTLQFKNKGVSQRMEKAGNFLISAEGDVSLASKKGVIAAAEAAMTLSSKEAMSLSSEADLVLKATGSVSGAAQTIELKAESKVSLNGQMVNIEGGSQIMAKSSMIVLDGITYIGGAGGLPGVLPTTQLIGIGNLGMPVVSVPIGPFASKTFMA